MFELMIMKRLVSIFCVLLVSGCAAFAHDGVKVEVLVESGASWDGQQLPAYPDGAAYISVVKVTVPPHAKLGWHKHLSINAGYVISGEVIVTAKDGSVRVVKAGEGLIELVDTWHYGRNDGEVPAEIVVVYVGTEGVPLAVMQDAEGS